MTKTNSASKGIQDSKKEVSLKLPLFFLFLTLYSGSYDFDRIVPTQIGIEFKYVLIVPTIFTTLLTLNLNRRSARRNGDETFLFLFSVFCLLSLISTLWAEANPYTTSYILDVIWVFVFSIISYFLAKKVNNDEIEFIAKIIISIGVVFMIAGFISSPGGQTRISAFGGGPNVYVRIILMAFLFSIFLYVKKRKIIYLVLAPPLMLAALLSGSRGGLVALAGAVAFLFLLYLVRPKQLLRLLSVGTVVGLVTVLYFYLNPAMQAWVRSRFFDSLFGDEVYTSGRDSLYEQGAEIFQNNPLFGIGLSSYAGLFEGNHPHNFFLEVAVSTGFIGLFILFLIFFYAFWHFFRNWNYNINILVFFLGFIFIIIASQFSGSFFDTRFAWVFVFFALNIMGSDQLPDVSSRNKTMRKRLM